MGTPRPVYFYILFSAKISVRNIMMKTLAYFAAVIKISKNKCNKLMRKVKNAALPKMGLNQKIGLKYLYGPIQYQGLTFPNLFTEL